MRVSPIESEKNKIRFHFQHDLSLLATSGARVIDCIIVGWQRVEWSKCRACHPAAQKETEKVAEKRQDAIRVNGRAA